MALTGKKRLFAEARFAGKSSKDAALHAGYSAATAAQAGSRLVKDPDVRMVIARLQKEADDALSAPPASKTPTTAGAPHVAPVGQGDGEQAPPVPLMYSDPKAFLMAAMNDVDTEPKLRVDAAKALMPFVHGKVGELGKKPAQGDAAKKASSGRFAPSAPPMLKSVK